MSLIFGYLIKQNKTNINSHIFDKKKIDATLIRQVIIKWNVKSSNLFQHALLDPTRFCYLRYLIRFVLFL